MLLLIDAGNTQIKWALTETDAAPGGFVQQGRYPRDAMPVAAPWPTQGIARVIVSNVAGRAVQDGLAPLLPAVPCEWFEARDSAAGIHNHYRFPQRLGSDRFASAIGAHALYPQQNLLVVTCGTATTIDAVSAGGDFVGGMIAPGLQTMARSLAINTAQLPQISESAGQAGFVAHLADHTDAAILSGCIAAQVGAIDYAARQWAERTSTPLTCVLAGGAARYLLPSLRIPCELVDNLVLIGLQVYSQC